MKPRGEIPDLFARSVDTPQLLGDILLKHQYGSTQFNLPTDLAESCIALAKHLIPEAELAGSGYEDAPHVTVKYGLHTDDPQDVAKVIANFGPVTIRLGDVSIFEASKDQGDKEAADVVKISVISPALRAINELIAHHLEHTDTHPDYSPHVTLAYVQAGKGKQYEGNGSLRGQTATFTELQFSSAEGQVTLLPLGESQFGKKSLAFDGKTTTEEVVEIQRDEQGRMISVTKRTKRSSE